MTATASANGHPKGLCGAWDAVRRGWCPVPIPYRAKGPTLRGWQQLRLDGLDVDALFPAGEELNVGALTGEPSGGLIDLDHDCAEARAASAFLAPPTNCVSGRRSAPDSHRWYVVSEPPAKATTQYNDPLRSGKGARLLEVRSTGGQTVIPPSLLPADPAEGKVEEPCVWHRDGDPAEVGITDLFRAAGRIAAAALLGRYWRRDVRHDSALALAGGLLRRGWPADDVTAFIRAVCAAAGDEEVDDRLKAVPYTGAKLKAGEKVTGWPTLAKLLGKDGDLLVSTVGGWIGVRVRIGGEEDIPGGQGATGTAQGRRADTEFTLGPVVIRPGNPRRTEGGKVVVPLTLSRGGKVIDDVVLNNSAAGRRTAAQLIAKHEGVGGRDQIEKLITAVLAWAVERLARPAAPEGDTVRAIVAARVPAMLRFTYRTPRGLWSEAESREMGRADLMAFVPSELLTAAAEGCDAPEEWTGLLRAVKDALEVLWADLRRSLQPAAELKEETAAGRAFHDAVVRIWKTTKTWEVSRDKDRATASRVSLAGMVQGLAHEYLTGKLVPTAREAWREIRPHVDAWWRPHAMEDGLCVVLLAMRYTLAEQIGVAIPETEDQKRFTELGIKYGVFTDTGCVSGRLSDGTRLSVLTQAVSANILAKVQADPAEPAPTDTGSAQ